MKRFLLYILLALSLNVSGQLSVGVGVGIPYNGKLSGYSARNQEIIDLLARYSYQPTDDIIELMDWTIDTLKYYDIWDSVYSIRYMASASNVDDMLLDWKNSNYDITLTGYVHPVQNVGIQRDLLNNEAILNTNLNPREIGANKNSFSIATYSSQTTRNNNTSQYILGAYDGTNVSGYQYWTSTKLLSYLWINSSSQTTSNLATKTRGTVLLTRTDGTNVSVYQEGVKNTYAKASSATPNVDFYLTDLNFNGTPNSYRQYSAISFMSLARGLTDTQAEKLKDINDKWYSEIISKVYKSTFDTANYTAVKPYIKGVAYNHYFLHFVKGNNRIAAFGDSLYLSVDGGENYDYRTSETWVKDSIECMFMWDNGNVQAFTWNRKIYLSTDSLQTWSEITLKKKDKVTDYVYHTPVNANYPGSYFFTFNNMKSTTIGGNEVLIFGNYGNSFTARGAVPTNLYMIEDNGTTATVIYEFGQNTSYRDNGSNGSSKNYTGNLLGDASSSELVRHVHQVLYTDVENDSVFYVLTGDDAAPFSGDLAESGIYKCIYHNHVDTVELSRVISSENTNYITQIAMASIEDDTLYFANEITSTLNGLYKCKLSELSNISNYIKYRTIPNSTYTLGYVKSGDMQMYTPQENEDGQIIYTIDNGVSWDTIVVSQDLFPPNFMVHIFTTMPDPDGYYYFDRGASRYNIRKDTPFLLKLKE